MGHFSIQKKKKPNQILVLFYNVCFENDQHLVTTTLIQYLVYIRLLGACFKGDFFFQSDIFNLKQKLGL